MTAGETCDYRVYRRDTYRYTGGKHHFALHYTEGTCRRKAVVVGKGGKWCKQHGGWKGLGSKEVLPQQEADWHVTNDDVNAAETYQD